MVLGDMPVPVPGPSAPFEVSPTSDMSGWQLMIGQTSVLKN
jgi:hypothetical protein